MSAAAPARGRPAAGVDAQSPAGRMLLALRAGGSHGVEVGDLAERFGSGYSSVLSSLVRRQLVTRSGADKNVTCRLTEAGRAACPLRNPLAVKTSPAPAGATGGRVATSSPRTVAPVPTRADEIFVLQRDDVRRLARFLCCFEIAAVTQLAA